MKTITVLKHDLTTINVTEGTIAVWTNEEGREYKLIFVNNQFLGVNLDDCKDYEDNSDVDYFFGPDFADQNIEEYDLQYPINQPMIELFEKIKHYIVYFDKKPFNFSEIQHIFYNVLVREDYYDETDIFAPYTHCIKEFDNLHTVLHNVYCDSQLMFVLQNGQSRFINIRFNPMNLNDMNFFEFLNIVDRMQPLIDVAERCPHCNNLTIEHYTNAIPDTCPTCRKTIIWK